MAATLSDDERPQGQAPTTLAEAQEMLWRERPARDAEPLVWVEFHRHSAQVYGRMAMVDQRHRHEATQCAGLEIRRARDIEHHLERGLNGGDQ